MQHRRKAQREDVFAYSCVQARALGDRMRTASSEQRLALLNGLADSLLDYLLVRGRRLHVHRRRVGPRLLLVLVYRVNAVIVQHVLETRKHVAIERVAAQVAVDRCVSSAGQISHETAAEQPRSQRVIGCPGVGIVCVQDMLLLCFLVLAGNLLGHLLRARKELSERGVAVHGVASAAAKPDQPPERDRGVL